MQTRCMRDCEDEITVYNARKRGWVQSLAMQRMTSVKVNAHLLWIWSCLCSPHVALAILTLESACRQSSFFHLSLRPLCHSVDAMASSAALAHFVLITWRKQRTATLHRAIPHDSRDLLVLSSLFALLSIVCGGIVGMILVRGL